MATAEEDFAALPEAEQQKVRDFLALSDDEKRKVALAIPHFEAQVVGNQYRATVNPFYAAGAEFGQRIQRPAPLTPQQETEQRLMAPVEQMQQSLNTVVGTAGRILGYPGQRLGETITDVSRGTRFGQPIPGTNIAPSDVASGLASETLNFFLPSAILKKSGDAIGMLERLLGKKLSTFSPVAFARRQQAIRQFQTEEGAPGPLVEQLKSGRPATELFDEVRQFNPPINIGPAQKIAGELTPPTNFNISRSASARFMELDKKLKDVQQRLTLNPENRALRESEQRLRQEIASAQPFSETISATGSSVPTTESIRLSRETIALRSPVPGQEAIGFQQVWGKMKEINEAIGSAKLNDPSEFRRLMMLKRGYIQSLENATEAKTGEAYTKLRQANQAFKQELAYDRVSEVLGNKIKLLEANPAPQAQNIASAQAIRDIRKFFKEEPDLAKAMPPGSINKILNGLEQVRRLPAFAASPGIDAGSKNMLMKLFVSSTMGGTTGAALGGAIAGTPGALVGGPIGTAAAYATGSMLAKALAKPGGIKFVENLMKASEGKTWGPEEVIALQVFIAGARQIQ